MFKPSPTQDRITKQYPPSFQARTSTRLENRVLATATRSVTMLPARTIRTRLAARLIIATFSPRIHTDAIDIVLNRFAANSILFNLATIAAEPSRRVRTVSRSKGLVLAAFVAAHLVDRAARVAAEATLATRAARLATVARRFRGAALAGRADALLGSMAAGLATAGALRRFAAETRVSVQTGLTFQTTESCAEEVLFLTAGWAAGTLEAGFPVDEGGGQG